MISREELIAELEAHESELSEYSKKQLKLLREAQAQVAAPRTNKGVVMAALYLLGASYSQIAYLCNVQKSTAAQAAKNHLGKALRAARPKPVNRAQLSWDQAAAYYRAAQTIEAADPVELTKTLMQQAEVDEDENDPYLRDKA